MRRILAAALLAILLAPFTLALPANDLPVRNIYDPVTRENEDIRHYTFFEIDALLANPKFRQWNDVPRVCEAIRILHGRPGRNCPAIVYDRFAPEPPWVRAYVPPGGYPPVFSAPRRVIYTGPPPWAYPPIPPPFPVRPPRYPCW